MSTRSTVPHSAKMSPEERERRQRSGVQIREAREAQGMTRRQLARKLGIVTETLATYEKPTSNPISLRVEARAREVLGLPAAEPIVSDRVEQNHTQEAKEAVARRLKRARMDQDLTPADIDRLLGLTIGTAANWERGRYPTRLEAVEEVLGPLPPDPGEAYFRNGHAGPRPLHWVPTWLEVEREEHRKREKRDPERMRRLRRIGGPEDVAE